MPSGSSHLQPMNCLLACYSADHVAYHHLFHLLRIGHRSARQQTSQEGLRKLGELSQEAVTKVVLLTRHSNMQANHTSMRTTLCGQAPHTIIHASQGEAPAQPTHMGDPLYVLSKCADPNILRCPGHLCNSVRSFRSVRRRLGPCKMRTCD